MPTDVTPVESSTTESVPVFSIQDMTPVESAAFMKDGTVPTRAASATATQETEPPAQPSGDSAAPPAEIQETNPKTEARIQKVLTQRREAFEKNQILEQENARLKGILEGRQIPVSPAGAPKATENANEPPKAPKLDDFETVAEYADALAKYADDVADFKVKKATESFRSESDAERSKREIADGFKSRVNAAKPNLPNFEAIAFNEALPLNQAMSQYIVDSDKGPEVAYFLGQNLEEATRISKLPPMRVIREMAFIESKLGAPAPAAPPKPKLTAAPPPSTELSGASGAPVDEAETALARGDMTRYMEIMNERDIKAGKRR